MVRNIKINFTECHQRIDVDSNQKLGGSEILTTFKTLPGVGKSTQTIGNKYYC